MTRVTLEPAVSVMLAPLGAVAFTLVPVGPSAAKLLVWFVSVPFGPPEDWNVTFNRLKLDVMLSLDDGGGVATFGGGGARGGGVPKMY